MWGTSAWDGDALSDARGRDAARNTVIKSRKLSCTLWACPRECGRGCSAWDHRGVRLPRPTHARHQECQRRVLDHSRRVPGPGAPLGGRPCLWGQALWASLSLPVNVAVRRALPQNPKSVKNVRVS